MKLAIIQSERIDSKLLLFYYYYLVNTFKVLENNYKIGKGIVYIKKKK